ncbi:MAG: hypothetical protein ABJM29_17150 [Rhizobiaceae bacterium]
MTAPTDNQSHERLIMLAIQPLIKELLLVDVADLIAYLTFDQHNQIADIVDSAAEQYFAPGFIGYREVGSADIDWDTSPSINLQLTMNAPSYSFEFSLTLESKSASIKLQRINPLTPEGAADDETSLKSLERAIDINSVKA